MENDTFLTASKTRSKFNTSERQLTTEICPVTASEM